MSSKVNSIILKSFFCHNYHLLLLMVYIGLCLERKFWLILPRLPDVWLFELFYFNLSKTVFFSMIGIIFRSILWAPRKLHRKLMFELFYMR